MFAKNQLKKMTPVWFKRALINYRYGFFGPYKNWSEVKKDTTGYDDILILEKVKNTLLKVKDEKIGFERDSIFFDKKEFTWPLLSCLFLIAAKNGGNLDVLDFGGSLGSIYWQNIDLLKQLNQLQWHIVEQPNFVSTGQKLFQNTHLNFYSSLNECLKNEKPQVLLLANTLQYLEKPYELLQEIIDKNFQYLILDRLSLTAGPSDFVVKQKVPPNIYPGSYPSWFLSEEKFRNFLRLKYNLLAEFPTLEGHYSRHGVVGDFKSFFFERK